MLYVRYSQLYSHIVSALPVCVIGQVSCALRSMFMYTVGAL